MNTQKPLSWQRVRHVLNDAGVLELGWKIGAKKDGQMVAMVFFPGDKPPGKRRTAKLLKVLQANNIAVREQDPNRFIIPATA